jgi:hypothetical protein
VSFFDRYLAGTDAAPAAKTAESPAAVSSASPSARPPAPVGSADPLAERMN